VVQEPGDAFEATVGTDNPEIDAAARGGASSAAGSQLNRTRSLWGVHLAGAAEAVVAL
jgi:hypothetical protein